MRESCWTMITEPAAGSAPAIEERLAGLSPEKRRLLERRLGRIKTAEASPLGDAIAVIGMGCRFPGGASSPGRFWRLLLSGRDAIGDVPAQRREWAVGPGAPDDPDNAVLRRGGFLTAVDEFDAAFFNISPREAQQMDPQQRLLLMTAWEALEEAGQPAADLAGSSAGVFVGIHSQSSDYYRMQVTDGLAIDTYTATGCAHSIVANRLSYLLDFKGPSLAVDTACSSSLAALHLACQSLGGRECDLALAGGVNLMLTPEASTTFAKLQFLSPEGRCKTFDARADGFVRGEGCGVVVLRRYADALAHGDPILALIRGSAINQDGATNGLTAPNGPAQQAVVRLALKKAGVAPADITFVETHGTGTVLGDPIEVEALAAVLRRDHPGQALCRLGAVKSNIGHLEAAAGIAGVIKTVLCLQHRFIPPNANFTELNPHIDLSATRLAIPREGASWEAPPQGRFGGVSAFGFGGTNVHVILQEAPPPAAQAGEGQRRLADRGHVLLPLSARSASALAAAARQWGPFLSGCREDELADVAYTASVRRDHHSYRLALTGSRREELAAGLEAFLQNRPHPGARWSDRETQPPALGPVFVYGGQGPQWFAMGRRLLAAEPVFRQALEQCADLLGSHAGWSLMTELAADEAHARLDQTEIAQPALFALQMALTALWQSWGIAPGAVVGHSLGEVAAACAAGVLSLEQAVRVVYHRGRLLQGATGQGRMAAVELSLADAQALVKDTAETVGIAAVNGPSSVTLSGEAGALEALLARLAERNVFTRWLNVNYAFHSPQVAPYQEPLTQAIGPLACRTPTVTTVSTVTARLFRDGDFGQHYWADNIRKPVRFWGALDVLIQGGHRTFVEIGPHPVLAAAIAQCLEHRAAQGQVLASLRRGTDEPAHMLAGLGRLYTLGHTVAWQGVYPPGRCRPLPSYPWHLRRCWITAAARQTAARYRRGPGHADQPCGAPTRLRSPLIQDVVFQWTPDPGAQPLLAEHRLFGQVVLAAPAWIEIVLAAAGEAFGKDYKELVDLRLQRTLALEAQDFPPVQVVFKRRDAASVAFEVLTPEPGSGPDGPWHVLVDGAVARGTMDPLPAPRQNDDPAGGAEEVPGEHFYASLDQRGAEVGALSRCIAAYRHSGGEVIARLSLPSGIPAAVAGERLHPVLVDACLQAAAIAAPQDDLAVVAAVERWRQWGPASAAAICRARPCADAAACGEGFRADVTLYTAQGDPVAEMTGVCLKRINASAVLGDRAAIEILEPGWLENPSPQGAPGDATADGNWVIFGDRSGVSEALVQLLAAHGGRCRWIEAGHAYATAGDRRSIAPEAGEHYARLAREWQDGGARPRAVVYLWGLDAGTGGQEEGEAPAQAALASGTCLLHLVKAMAALDGICPPLWVVTRGAQVLEAGEWPRLAQAPLWGLGRVIAVEHPEIWGGLVDLDPGSPAETAARQLLAQMTAGDGQWQVLLRRDRRFVPALVPQAPPAATAALDSRATYLIVGGLGSLGLQTAVWMTAQGARRLVLAARTPLPERGHWARIGPDDPQFNRIAAIRAMEAGGAEVRPVALDMADEEQVRGLLSMLGREGWLPIRGVIHAAAVVRDALLSHMSPEALAESWRPKIQGAWLLHRLLGDQPLDFMVFFSSLGALLGQTGQGAYAAANGFLDALAHYRRAGGRTALSINWGGWSGAGLAATAGGRRTTDDLARQGITSLSPQVATRMLGALLTGAATQAVVTGIDRRRLRHRPVDGAPLLLSELVRAGAAAGLEEEATAPAGDLAQALHACAAGGPRQEMMENEAAGMLAAVLKMEAGDIDPEKPFGQMGLDSLTAVELKNLCESRTGLRLSATLAWNYPTVRTLAAHLAHKLGISLDGQAAGAPEAPPALGRGHAEEASANRVLESVANLSDEEALRHLLGDR